MAKNKKPNWKVRLKEELTEKIKNCKSHTMGRRLISQGILNKIIDLGDAMKLKELLPPKPNVKVTICDPNAPLYGILLRTRGMYKIQLDINEDGTWSNGEVTVTKTGVTILNEEGTELIFASVYEEIADAWHEGAKTMASLILDVTENS